MSTFDQTHFDNLYAADIDPWRFRNSTYEAEKYRATLQALPSESFCRCLELGCSIGVLTRLLAERCESIVAVDTSEKALAEARKVCHAMPVNFVQAHLPDGDFGDGFDLVIASEVLYYLEPAALRQLARKLVDVVKPGACCVAVHWTGETDYPMTADDAVILFEQEASLRRVSQQNTASYRLDVWSFPDPVANP